MMWAWKSIARGRARLDDVIPCPMQDARLPRRGCHVAAENASRHQPQALSSRKQTENRLSSITRYVRIVSCARTRGQKKRAPRIGRRRRLKDHRAGRPAAGITVGQMAET